MSEETEIFSKVPEHHYIEEAPLIESAEFEKVVRSRRSVRVYKEEKIPDDIVKKCLELALLAPNSSNLQPWSFYWVKSAEKKQQVVECCLSQPAARTAPTLIVAVANTYSWKKNAKQMLEVFSSQKDVKIPKSAVLYYKKLVPFVYSQGLFGEWGLIKKFIFFMRGLFTPTPREPTSKSHMKIWASKTVALACQNLMLSFRAYGYDTCPMEGYDSSKLKSVLGLSCCEFPVMVISAGKRASNGIYGPQVRFDSSQFIKEI